MTHLNTAPNFGIPGQRQRHAYTPGDDFYDLLVQGHHGLSNAQSELMNACLVLLLANHIGDLRVLQQAIMQARMTAAASAAAAPAQPPAADAATPPPEAA